MFINFLRLLLLLAHSLVFVGVDEKTVDELRKGLSARINDHGESKMVKRMSRQYKIVHGAQKWAEVDAVDIFAAYLRSTQAGFMHRVLSSECFRLKQIEPEQLREHLAKTPERRTRAARLEPSMTAAKKRKVESGGASKGRTDGAGMVKQLTDGLGFAKAYKSPSAKFAIFETPTSNLALPEVGGGFHVAYSKYGTSSSACRSTAQTLLPPRAQAARHPPAAADAGRSGS